jgi:hypothetical protein
MYSPYADGHSPVGFPHSEISGSRPVSGSPELIAAVHVLHRLWLPRHPPYALCSLTLSLRHASSRARDSTSESFATPFRVFVQNCYPWTFYPHYSVFNDRGWHQGHRETFQVCAALARRGGADRDRTDDLRLAKPALSQLSYSPGLRHLIHRGPGQS